MKNWTTSLLFIPLYMGLFLFWQAVPTRPAFVIGSLVVAAAMTALIVRAGKADYFKGRADFFLHAYVVADVLLEGFAFEVLLLGDRYGLLTAAEADHLHGLVRSFHANFHFIGCTTFFVALIGLNRFYALTKRTRETTPEPAPAQSPATN